MKRRLVGLAKLALVAALFWFVFSDLQWHDRLTTSRDNVVVEQIDGDILDRWDAPLVRFRPEGSEAELVVRTGAQADGTEIAVAPGLPTYFVQLDKLWFALGALAYLVTLTAAAARWWWLLHVNSLDVRLGEALRFTWIGVFFNNVVPGQTGGDVVKALYVVKRCPGGRVRALMSVIVDRILGLASLALLGAVAVLFYLDDPEFVWLAAAIWGVLLFVAALAVVAFSRRLRRMIRLDQLLRRLPPRIAAPLMKVDEAVFFYRRHKGGILVWLLVGTVNHVVTVASFWFMGRALGVGMPAAEYFVLVPVILIISAVPIAPNGWGVGEFLFGNLFARFGAGYLPPEIGNPELVMKTRGVALSVLYRLHTTAWSLVGGAMLLFDRDRVTRSEVEAEMSREDTEDAARPASA